MVCRDSLSVFRIVVFVPRPEESQVSEKMKWPKTMCACGHMADAQNNVVVCANCWQTAKLLMTGDGAHASRRTPSADEALREAVKAVTDAISQDPGYRISWSASIAMAFKDEVARNPSASVHDQANAAAENFLDILCSRSSTPPAPVEAGGPTLIKAYPTNADSNDPGYVRVEAGKPCAYDQDMACQTHPGGAPSWCDKYEPAPLPDADPKERK